jgi:hypothetical protein
MCMDVFLGCVSLGGFGEVLFFQGVLLSSLGLSMCVSWWSHVSSNELIVVMSAYNLHWGGLCWFPCVYLARCGCSIDVAICFGCVAFRHAVKYFAKC